MNKRVTLTTKELRRIHVMHEIEAQRLSAAEASEILHLSIRHIRRLIRKHRYAGDTGLAHGNRGRASTRRLSEEIRAQILDLAKNKYLDYNDCHLTEKLVEEHGILVSRSTVRNLRREAGLSSPRKRRAPRHRRRRERKPRAGMMLQADGSHHDWLEGRGPKLALIGFIDDATSEVLAATFRQQEDAAGYLILLREICLTRGIPSSLYADRHTIFQSPQKPTLEQELRGEMPRSQLGRVCNELGIELIPASSPQAHGRIERLWETWQDRLVKELREAGASQLEQANPVVTQYLPQHNCRFAVPAALPGSAYLPWPAALDPDQIFCFKYQRRVANDNTISFAGHKLSIPPNPTRANYARAQVELHHQLDGRLVVRHQGMCLVIFEPKEPGPPRVGKFQPASRALPEKSSPVTTRTSNPSTKSPPKPRLKPATDHPWRRSFAVKGKRKDEKDRLASQSVPSSLPSQDCSKKPTHHQVTDSFNTQGDRFT
jgi:transposase